MTTGRFAPTPSGYLHPGNILCAMLAYLAVRKQGGRFLLRVEDLDVPRCPEKLVKACIRDLQWLGFRWDEEPVCQSRRNDAYQAALKKLEEQGLVYPCFCTRAQLHSALAPNFGDQRFIYPGTCAHRTSAEAAALSAVRKPAYRFRAGTEPVIFTDLLKGTITEKPSEESGDFILRRSDGLFAYQLAVTVDDGESGVNEVVRGDDILAATPGQVDLLRKLGFSVPHYAHIPLVTDPQGKRLSKRDGSISIEALSKEFSPENILGILAMAAGLQPEPVPHTLEELIPLMDWKKIPAASIRLPGELFRLNPNYSRP